MHRSLLSRAFFAFVVSAPVNFAMAESHPAALITGGQILTPSINVAAAPAAPRLSVAYKAPGGLRSLSVTLSSTTSTQAVTLTFGTPQSTTGEAHKGTILLQDPLHAGLGLYAAPGTWQLSAATVCGQDYLSACTSYSASQLAALFANPTVTVTNAVAPDVRAPTLGHGKLLTRTFSRSKCSACVLHAAMNVADDVSGALTATIFFTAPNAAAGGTAWQASAPVMDGRFDYYEVFGDGQTGPAPGVYTITGIEACDTAGNCQVYSNEADIMRALGTASFTVTD